LTLLNKDVRDFTGSYMSSLTVEVAGEELSTTLITPRNFSQQHPSAAADTMRQLRKDIMAQIEKRLFQGLM